MTVLAAETQKATRATDELAGATLTKAEADKKAEADSRRHAKQLGQVRTAALASAASMTGLRGAVLTAGASFLGATIAIQAFSKAVRSAANLETELNVFRVTAAATADEMERVREEAVALGRDITLPAVSAGDAAQAITLLARAGLSVEDSLAGARGVLQLATAAEVDFATATDLAASALNAFGLAGEEAVRVADLLANSANLSQGTVTDMGIALRQSAGAAAQVGLSLEDTVTVLTALARTGLAGSDAGTTLRVALLRLVAPTKDAQKALERFNIDLRNATGDLRVEALFELEAALRGVTRAEADRVRVAIFGQNAFRVSALLGRESAQSFRDLEDAVTKQGAAAELAGARTQGFAGQMEALSSNLETLGTSLGGLVLPGLSTFVGAINDLVSTVALGVDGLRQFQRATNLLGSEFDELVPGGERVSDVLRTIGKDVLGPQAGFVFTARQINRVVDVFSEGADQIEGDATHVEADVRELFATFSEAGGIGSPTAVNEFVQSLDELADKLAEGDPAAQRLARRIRELIKELQNPATFRVDLALDFDESELKAAGVKAGDQTVQGALLSLRAGESQVADTVLGWFEDLAPEVEKIGGDTGDAFVKGFNDAQIRGQLQAQKTAVAQAQAFGDTGLEELIAERNRIDRILNSAKAPTGPALEALFNERASVVAEINRILQDQEDASQKLKDEAQEARDERDRNILDAIGLEEQKRTNAVIRAQATAGAKDDLQANIALRNFYRRIISEIQKTVKDAKLAAQAIAEATTDLIRADQAIKDAKRALRQQRREEREREAEGTDLDIELAQITENEAKEIALRQKRIKQLQDQIKHEQGNTNKIKQLRNEIARQKEAIKELKGEQDESNRSAQEFFFSQLQAQQGFAANLLGNLITGPTEGLVGVPAPAPVIPDLGARIGAEAGAAAGRAAAVPTAGQANTEIDVLRRILFELQRLNGSYDAPEAINQKKQGSGSMDIAVM